MEKKKKNWMWKGIDVVVLIFKQYQSNFIFFTDEGLN